jgi:hypothetical protein
MSDKPEGPGWWIASDGNWYPPEQHPSATDDPGRDPPQETGTTQPRRWQGHTAHVGPQFPDLFKKAMEGSQLADNVSVKHDGDDQRIENQPTISSSGSVVSVSTGVAGATIGAPTKRRWRKGH